MASSTMKALALLAIVLVFVPASEARRPPRRPPTPVVAPSVECPKGNGLDPAILNFALNLEYLEANFYHCAAFGTPIPAADRGARGVAPLGCKKANLGAVAQAYAEAIALDELAHVKLLRAALGAAAVDQPLMDIGAAFNAAATAAFGGPLPECAPFDAYGDDVLFYHAAFIFEDVGVTAYKGAAKLIDNKDILEVAAGILAVEAYHGGAVRALLLDIADNFKAPYGVQVKDIIAAISKLRAAASGAMDDQGLLKEDGGYIVAPADASAVAFSRSVVQVLNIVYLGGANKGGFYPNGLNGAITKNVM